MSADGAARPGRGLPWAGLAIGPGALAVNQQVSYMLAPLACGWSVPVIPILALVLALLAGAGALLSWRGLATAEPEPEDAHRGGQPRRLLALVGTAGGLLFGLAILAQGAAALVLEGCEW